MSRTVRVVLILALAVSGLVTIGATAAAGGGCHAPTEKQSTARGAGDVLVGIGECQFMPTVLYVDPGTKVTWINKDPVPHTVTGALMAWGSADPLDQSNRASYRFDEEGIYPYQCFFHPGMSAAVVVGDATDAKAGAAPAEVAPEIEPETVPVTKPRTIDLEDTKDEANLPGLSLSAVALLLGARQLARSRRTI